MKVLVCGGRTYSDKANLFRILDDFHVIVNGITELIHGGATGADSIAEAWAKEHKIETLRFPADWKRFGKKAGFIRNQQMLDEGRPKLVIAFPGGPGTEMMKNLATRTGVYTIEVVGPQMVRMIFRKDLKDN